MPGCKINVGCMVGKIIPKKIKKKEPEITTTFNIGPREDIPTTRDTNREGEGELNGLF